MQTGRDRGETWIETWFQGSPWASEASQLCEDSRSWITAITAHTGLVTALCGHQPVRNAVDQMDQPRQHRGGIPAGQIHSFQLGKVHHWPIARFGETMAGRGLSATHPDHLGIAWQLIQSLVALGEVVVVTLPLSGRIQFCGPIVGTESREKPVFIIVRISKA
jgi:hypothetical protein